MRATNSPILAVTKVIATGWLDVLAKGGKEVSATTRVRQETMEC